MGQKITYPWNIIPYKSKARVLWNRIIVAIILYELFWYPIACTFDFKEKWHPASFIFEIVSLVIFLFDIILNCFTTYSNENNEEIINTKMIMNHYVKTKLFIIDVFTTFPLPEILLAIVQSNDRWTVYSLTVLPRMLRFFKIFNYMHGTIMKTLAKYLKICLVFFLIVIRVPLSINV